MAEVEVKCSPVGPANNEIWYTSSSGEIVTPYSGYNNNNATALQTFGANIVSNTYKNGMGVITFDAPVTSIGDWAFSYCESLTSVTIPNSVTSIERYAFDCCTSLTSVAIPNSVTLIGDYAFDCCTSLTSITIPDSITSIGAGAFRRCTSLTSITIPDSVTSIGEDPFIWCSSLEAFYGKFASSDNRCLIVNEVLNSFAIGCGATEYTIPNSVTSIGSSAFSGCTSLTSVTIPDSVTSIRDYAFYGCRSLTSITIPDSVTSIGWGAFEDCTSLKEVYCKPTTPPTGGCYMFSYYNSGYKTIGCKIYVPTESVEAYKTAEYWSDYASYIVGYDF
ncbi:MAG: leucine-rich repeat domain-containing protein [Rikenellaceae bacterium]|nr:leucine-rich repeat domain-containing protein [Rikenellaceae bacterium]